MSKNDAHDRETAEAKPESFSALGNKKIYSAPRILSRESLETIAVACVKKNSKSPGGPGCVPGQVFS
jgi:hypothetical protein